MHIGQGIHEMGTATNGQGSENICAESNGTRYGMRKMFLLLMVHAWYQVPVRIHR